MVEVIVVLATGSGTPTVVGIRGRGLLWFEFKPVQKTEPHCLGRIETRTGHKPVFFWPGISCRTASFS